MPDPIEEHRARVKLWLERFVWISAGFDYMIAFLTLGASHLNLDIHNSFVTLIFQPNTEQLYAITNAGLSWVVIITTILILDLAILGLYPKLLRVWNWVVRRS